MFYLAITLYIQSKYRPSISAMPPLNSKQESQSFKRKLVQIKFESCNELSGTRHYGEVAQSKKARTRALLGGKCR
jgi:hypothetical protein